jgi:hypothetical protein
MTFVMAFDENERRGPYVLCGHGADSLVEIHHGQAVSPVVWKIAQCLQSSRRRPLNFYGSLRA